MWKKGLKILGVIIICVLFFSIFIMPLSANTSNQKDSSFPALLPPPPIGFNPLTASPKGLKTYGFPQRPTDQKSLQSWENAMEHAKYYGKPQQKLVKGIHHDFWDSNNLSGIGVYGQNNKNINNGDVPLYTATSAYWVMPDYSPGYSSTSEIASYWTGIGGIENLKIIVQAGADANLAYLGYSPSYEFWVENYWSGDPGPTYESYPPVTGGDTVYVSVTYNGATSTAFLENYSTGQYTTVPFNTQYYDGSSANFLFENLYPPVPNSVYDNIPTVHFSQTDLSWKDASGAQGGGESTAYNYTQCRQHNEWLQVKSYPTNISNGAFDIIAHN